MKNPYRSATSDKTIVVWEGKLPNRNTTLFRVVLTHDEEGLPKLFVEMQGTDATGVEKWDDVKSTNAVHLYNEALPYAVEHLVSKANLR